MAPTRSPPEPSGAAQDRMVGRVLGGRYRVLSRLGEGGMGTVYLCEHAVLGRKYAVKVLRPDLGEDAELVERFRNEAIAASRIGGENVVDVLDFGEEDDGAFYYVMEALEGRSLGALIAEGGPIEVPRALALVEQVCRALGAAHARGVVHRDVKPDNVFVVRREDGTERAKVIDFGISQVALEGGRTERLTEAGAIMGTPEYMAPEQAAGDKVDHRADVYALGVLAYEMLTGTLPILATTPIATLVAHQTRVPDAPSRRRAGIPPEVDALVLAALAKRPEDRPSSMGAFAAAIVALRGSAALRHGAAPPTRSSRQRGDTLALPPAPRPLHRRVRGAIAVAIAAALLASAASIWARWGRRAPAIAPAPVAAGPAAHEPAPATPPPPGTAAAAPPEPRREPPAVRTARRPSRERHVDDPYTTGALKPDPFR
jgi:serine/threonine-protein kinase